MPFSRALALSEIQTASSSKWTWVPNFFCNFKSISVEQWLTHVYLYPLKLNQQHKDYLSREQEWKDYCHRQLLLKWVRPSLGVLYFFSLFLIKLCLGIFFKCAWKFSIILFLLFSFNRFIKSSFLLLLLLLLLLIIIIIIIIIII